MAIKQSERTGEHVELIPSGEDQPTTCPKCGARVELHNRAFGHLGECLSPRCEFKFRIQYEGMDVDDVSKVQILCWKAALNLEILGMGRRGRSVYSLVKEYFGWRGNRGFVLKLLTEYCMEGNT